MSTPLTPRIALLLVNDTNEYQQLVRRDAEDAARRASLEIELLLADNDFVQQIRQLYSCINRPAHERPRMALLFPVRDGSLESVLRDAARAGIGCGLLNRRPKYLASVRREFPGIPFGTIGPDQTELGRLQVQQAVSLLPSGGFVLYVMGPGLSSAAQDRLDGFRQGVKEHEIDHSVIHGDWSSDVAHDAVVKWLRLVLVARQRVHLVVCQNDAMAVGARRALDDMADETHQPELRQIRVTGLDGRPDVGQRLVNEGLLAATIIQSSSGRPAVDWAARCLAGQQTEMDVVLPVAAYPALSARMSA